MHEQLSNLERLRMLYDPAYVRRIDMFNGGAPVRVCIETRMLRDDAATGVATYARMLARCLPEAGAVPLLLDDGPVPRRRAARWLAAMRRTPRRAVQDHVHPQVQWMSRDLFREAQVFFNLHGRLMPVQLSDAPEVMHWTYPVPLYLVGTKNLYTVHDLIPLTDPGLTPIPGGRHARMLEVIADRAEGLVTVSETMRGLVVDRLGVPAARVFNTYQAVEAPLQVDPPLPPMLRPGRYLLFCGRVEPRKNLARLVDAHRASGTELPLVVVGPTLPEAAATEALLDEAEGVIRLPWLPRPQLIGLIRRARGMVFPSLVEGFGLPIVEAMTLGCPVLTSNRGAPAEIAGDAAWTVTPEDVGEIATGIARLAADDALCTRLRAAGFARGRLFSPPVYAARLRMLYDQVLGAVEASA